MPAFVYIGSLRIPGQTKLERTNVRPGIFAHERALCGKVAVQAEHSASIQYKYNFESIPNLTYTANRPSITQYYADN